MLIDLSCSRWNRERICASRAFRGVPSSARFVATLASSSFQAAFLVAAFAILPDLALAGAWTQPSGTLYNRIAVNRYTSDEELDVGGNREQLPLNAEFIDLNFGDYFEYGITDRFTTFGSIAVKRLRSEDDVRITKSWGIGDADLGMRAQIMQGRLGIVSAQALARFPTGYDEDEAIPLGSGKSEVEGRLLYGGSLRPIIPGYCGFEAGYRHRAGSPEDEFRYLAEIGSDLGKQLYVRAKLDGVRGLERWPATDPSGNPTVRESYDLGTLYATLGRRFGRTLSLEADFAPSLYGRTTSAGFTFSLAAAFTLTGFLGRTSEGRE